MIDAALSKVGVRMLRGRRALRGQRPSGGPRLGLPASSCCLCCMRSEVSWSARRLQVGGWLVSQGDLYFALDKIPLFSVVNAGSDGPRCFAHVHGCMLACIC